jgi:hypothetical protein
MSIKMARFFAEGVTISVQMGLERCGFNKSAPVRVRVRVRVRVCIRDKAGVRVCIRDRVRPGVRDMIMVRVMFRVMRVRVRVSDG